MPGFDGKATREPTLNAFPAIYSRLSFLSSGYARRPAIIPSGPRIKMAPCAGEMAPALMRRNAWYISQAYETITSVLEDLLFNRLDPIIRTSAWNKKLWPKVLATNNLSADAKSLNGPCVVTNSPTAPMVVVIIVIVSLGPSTVA